MPSISTTLQISTGGLAALQAVPQQLESLVNAARSNLSSIHTGAAAGNPFSALLGNFQTLAGQAANLPDFGPVLAPVQSLVVGGMKAYRREGSPRRPMSGRWPGQSRRQPGRGRTPQS